jgi:hypothetical protein
MFLAEWLSFRPDESIYLYVVRSICSHFLKSFSPLITNWPVPARTANVWIRLAQVTMRAAFFIACSLRTSVLSLPLKALPLKTSHPFASLWFFPSLFRIPHL